MQARWGSHGDYPIIVLAPASVREIYDETIRAFDLAETCRTPVVLLYDQVIAQSSETVALDSTPKAARPSANGRAARARTTSLTPPATTASRRWRGPAPAIACTPPASITAENGFPTQNPEAVERNLGAAVLQVRAASRTDRLLGGAALRGRRRGDRRDRHQRRAPRRAPSTSAAPRGVRVGLFRPITLWPFPEAALREAAKNARAVLVPEMNAGQLSLEVERILGRDKVEGHAPIQRRADHARGNRRARHRAGDRRP